MAKAELDHSDEYVMLEKRIKFITQFVKLKTMEPEKICKICENILSMGHEEVENYMRCGDVYATLVETLAQRGLFREALTKVHAMQEARIEIGPYLEAALLDRIAKETGQSVHLAKNAAANYAMHHHAHRHAGEEEPDYAHLEVFLSRL